MSWRLLLWLIAFVSPQYSFLLHPALHHTRLVLAHGLAISSDSMSSSSTKPDHSVPNVAILLKQALAEHKNGDFDAALAHYLQCLPSLTGSTAASVHSNTGAIYMNHLGDWEAARAQFEASITFAPQNAHSHYNLAVLLTSRLGMHAKALKHCKIAMGLDETMYKAWHLMGNILQNMGREDDALKYFVQAERMAQAQTQQVQPQPVTSSTSSSNADEETSAAPPLDWASMSPLAATGSGVRPDSSVVVPLDHGSVSLSCISVKPLIFHVGGLLTDEECDHVKRRGGESLANSFVSGGSRTSSSENTSYRVSENAWLTPDDQLRRLQQRIAILTGLPLSYILQSSESLQVVRYQSEGHFNVHQDSSAFHPRLLTALVYLNEVVPVDGGDATQVGLGVEGDITAIGGSRNAHRVSGGTWFPYANSRFGVVSSPGEAEGSPTSADVDRHIQAALASRLTSESSDAPLKGCVVRPKKGDAVIFFNHLPSGEIDLDAVHAGLPVLPTLSAESSAEKWVANYWVGLDMKTLKELM